MSRHPRGSSRFRLAAAAPALALLVTGLTTTAGGGAVVAAPEASPDRPAQAGPGSEYYINYAAPQVEAACGPQEVR